jgi:hypothetical protein
MHRAWLTVPLLLLGGCTARNASGPIPLFDPVRVTAVGAPAPDSAVRFHAVGGVGARAADIDLPVRQLTLVLVTDGDRAKLEELVLAVDDMNIPPDVLPPSGLPLRDLRIDVHAPGHMQVVQADENALALMAPMPLVLDWSMALPDGSLWPLGPAATDPLTLALAVTRTADGTRVAVDATCRGTCWSLPGMVEVSDLSVHGASSATVEDATSAPAPATPAPGVSAPISSAIDALGARRDTSDGARAARRSARTGRARDRG